MVKIISTFLEKLVTKTNLLSALISHYRKEIYQHKLFGLFLFMLSCLIGLVFCVYLTSSYSNIYLILFFSFILIAIFYILLLSIGMISAAINSNSKVSYFKITRKNGIIKKEPITPWYAKNKNTEDSFIKTEEFNNLNTAKINDAPVKSLKYFFSSSHNFKLFDNCIKQNASTLTKTKFILIYLHVMLVDKKISAININQKHTAEILTNYTKTIKTNKKLEITESTYSRTQTSWNENYPFTDISDQHHKKFTEVEFITRLYTKNKT